ncbi:MAG: SAM-dependent methyltransferase [Leptolyngbyaceae cyanobacterium RU_5_1]|nr:SAM-dependent methyltransferase [Leptolyngbyaceae cyanobacterium RU_5_1]
MVMKLDAVVPFGRSLDEYQKMFSLSETELKLRILGVADGPASFNAEATKVGSQVISIDPIYRFSGAEILHRFNQVVDTIIAQVKATPDSWVWSYHQSPEGLRNNRIKAIQTFLSDYEIGKQQGRYQIGELPKLSCKDSEYDIALCSHFLFLYSEHYDFQFHWQSIQEMLRVSQEVRIFPLLTLMLERSPYLDQIICNCSEMGHTLSIQRVQYGLQKGGNEMLVIRNAARTEPSKPLP